MTRGNGVRGKIFLSEVHAMFTPRRDPPVSVDRAVNRRTVAGSHYHNEHELYCLVAGETKYVVGERIFHLKPGDFIFIPRGVLHQTDSEGCMNRERILLSIADDVFDRFLEPVLQQLTEQCVFRIPAGKRYETRELLEKIQQEFQRQEPNWLLAVRLLTQQLLVQLGRLRSDYAPDDTEDERLMNDIAAYIRANYAGELSLTVLSRRFGLSESCLSRKFKQITGMGLSEYITNVRIHNAARLLKEERLTVSQVAFRCGYNDSNYFAAVFKKNKGITPLKYAKG